MSTEPLKVFVVAQDRTILRQLSKFLQLIGYRVRQATAPEQARQAIEAEQPDFLIVDGQLFPQGGRDLCRVVCGQDWPSHVHTLLLIDGANDSLMSDALEAGIDDFLKRPVVFGELLARLRAGARVMERERRVRRQAQQDARTGLASRAEFVRVVRKLAQAGRAPRQASLALVDIDFFSRFNHLYGLPAADALLRDFAVRLRHLAGERASCFCFGGDAFAVLLLDQGEKAAVAWAENLCRELTNNDYAVGEAAAAVAVSVGVAEFQIGADTPDEAAARANDALQSAKRSGRGCVAAYASLGEEAEAWAELAAPGRLFERTLARDVMTPCAVFLRPDDSTRHAAEMLAQTQLKQIPVVDVGGKLFGLASHESLALAAESNGKPSPVRDAVERNPDTVCETATFADLMEFFTTSSASFVLVVNDERPTGFVTRQGLAALSAPLTSESFAARGPLSAESEYLLVPEGVGCGA